VWAAARADIPELKDKIRDMRQNYKDNPDEADYESILHDLTIPLGETDSNGELTCTFENNGGYLLITAKKGSLPGFTGILIAEPQLEPTRDIVPEELPN
jgi:hypothetical protein